MAKLGCDWVLLLWLGRGLCCVVLCWVAVVVGSWAKLVCGWVVVGLGRVGSRDWVLAESWLGWVAKLGCDWVLGWVGLGSRGSSTTEVLKIN